MILSVGKFFWWSGRRSVRKAENPRFSLCLWQVWRAAFHPALHYSLSTGCTDTCRPHQEVAVWARTRRVFSGPSCGYCMFGNQCTHVCVAIHYQYHFIWWISQAAPKEAALVFVRLSEVSVDAFVATLYAHPVLARHCDGIFAVQKVCYEEQLLIETILHTVGRDPTKTFRLHASPRSLRLALLDPLLDTGLAMHPRVFTHVACVVHVPVYKRWYCGFVSYYCSRRLVFF